MTNPTLTFSHDPEVGSIYCYLAELEEGDVVDSREYPAHAAVDREGRIFGLAIDLDDEIILSQLELALDMPFCWLEGERGRLWLRIADEEPARLVRLAETAILDFDADEVLLGVELPLPPEGRTPEALARLAPLFVEVDAAPEAGDGPVVFAPPPPDEENEDELEDASEGDDELGDADEGDDEVGDAEEDDDELDRLRDEVDVEPAGAPATPEAAPPEGPARVGFVALVGKPNVGKSTLLNALLGQKVAIVSPRPQTTRTPLRGVLHRADAQIVFVDTPGIHDPQHRLGRFMVDLARRTLPNVDVICFMVDISQPPSRLDRQIAELVGRSRAAKLLVLNKVDLPPRGGESYLEAYRALGEWEMELAVSARRRKGLEGLVQEIAARLPEGQRLYPHEQLTDQSEQQLASELVREKILHFTQQEVPHAVAVEVEEWAEREGATYIRATINVEKESQKGILIGAGGAMLKRIGSAARADVERMLGRRVYLDLWVKVRPNWRDDPAALGWLGYRAKDFQ